MIFKSNKRHRILAIPLCKYLQVNVANNPCFFFQLSRRHLAHQERLPSESKYNKIRTTRLPSKKFLPSIFPTWGPFFVFRRRLFFIGQRRLDQPNAFIRLSSPLSLVTGQNNRKMTITGFLRRGTYEFQCWNIIGTGKLSGQSLCMSSYINIQYFRLLSFDDDLKFEHNSN